MQNKKEPMALILLTNSPQNNLLATNVENILRKKRGVSSYIAHSMYDAIYIARRNNLYFILLDYKEFFKKIKKAKSLNKVSTLSLVDDNSLASDIPHSINKNELEEKSFLEELDNCLAQNK